MPPDTHQLQHWTGEFGDAYVDRNPPAETAISMRLRALSGILSRTVGDPPRSILECGCNLGLNLRALRRFYDGELFAIEPNGKARARVLADGVLDQAHLAEATLAKLPHADASMDLVFTSGVLIHVSPSDLDQAMREIHRVSRKYVLAVEYFSHQPQAIKYRGHEDLLWTRDFGDHYMTLFPDLVPVDTGFLWQRTSGYDNAMWWLFRKR